MLLDQLWAPAARTGQKPVSLGSLSSISHSQAQREEAALGSQISAQDLQICTGTKFTFLWAAACSLELPRASLKWNLVCYTQVNICQPLWLILSNLKEPGKNTKSIFKYSLLNSFFFNYYFCASFLPFPQPCLSKSIYFPERNIWICKEVPSASQSHLQMAQPFSGAPHLSRAPREWVNSKCWIANKEWGEWARKGLSQAHQ